MLERPLPQICMALAGLLWTGPARAQWTHLAGDAAHSALAERAARDLDTVRWSAAPFADEQYVWHASPVVHDGRVFVSARHYDPNCIQDGNLLIAYDIFDGSRRWSAALPGDDWGSWSSPAVDTRHDTVLIATGQTLSALDCATGNMVWQTALGAEVVNASPVVTTDLFHEASPANRVFVTDYSGYGSAGTLYAVNTDPDSADNPYQPGQIVWTATLPGTSGNTPAYHDGVVYVASTGGVVAAFEAAEGGLLWQTAVDLAGFPPGSGFFGGLCYQGGFLYLALYAFHGISNSAGLYKLDAATGEIVWMVPCERSDSIPVVTGDGRIYLSAGIAGYGSAPRLQAFQDHGDYATLLWDTFADTGGSLIVGGWTHQPAFSRGYLYVGTPQQQSEEFFLPYTDFYILNPAVSPADQGFVVAHLAGCGGPPAVADAALYSIGTAGLLAIEPSPACLADIDGDGTVGLTDLAALMVAHGSVRGEESFSSGADLDRNGIIDLADLAALIAVYGEPCP